MRSKRKQITKYLLWPKWLTFGVIFLLFFTATFIRLDPDFGWHLRSGQEFFINEIPAYDIFTYTASDFPWINHEWLSDIILYLIHSLGGVTLLAVFYSSLWTLSIYIVGRKALSPIVILATLLILPFSGIRAITYSVLGLSLLIGIINSKNKKLIYVVPFIFLVWANMHGSFVLGLAYVGYKALLSKSRRLFALLAIGSLCTVINPYGYHIYVEVIRTLMDSKLSFRIAEWQPLIIPISAIPIVSLYILGIAMRPRKKLKDYLSFPNFMLLASLSSQRNWPIFGLFSIRSTSKDIENIILSLPKKLKPLTKRVFIFIGLLFCVFSTYSLYNTIKTSSNHTAYTAPEVVAYLKENPCEGNIFNHYNFGGYLIWQLPNQKVYIDGRMPSWESVSEPGRMYMDNYEDILNSEEFARADFAKHDITCVLIFNNNTELFTWISKDINWGQKIKTDAYSLFIKNANT